MTTTPARSGAFQRGSAVTPPAEATGLDSVRMAATLVSAAVIIAALYYGRDVIIPLAFAFLIGFALSPPVTWLRRRGLPKVVAVGLVMTVVLILLASLVLILGAQLRSLSEQLPSYQTTIHEKLSNLRTQLKGPGLLDGALRTFDTVQQEVEGGKGTAAPGTPQQVEVVQAAGSQIQMALLWLGKALEPLAMIGIVFVFVVLALLDRTDLRDRLLRILGGNLHRSTDAIEEAAKRISRYLLMQFVVNLTYGVPLAGALWLIGVPGAPLWGVVAAVMRFVPYVGPLISAVFPLTLAFAVDPGWHMVIWTVVVILGLELVINNVVEPMLYGTSTGLSAMSLIAAATFWTALWGPVGLILSTPLTVCLLVIGKNLPQLQFFDTLLGSMPVLSPATRVYQRLLANDVEEVVEIAEAEIEKDSVVGFYDAVGIEALRLASDDYGRQATAEHRLRVAEGMDALLDELREEHPPIAAGEPQVLCIGGKWEIDAIAAEMLSHSLGLEGIAAATRPVTHATMRAVAKLDLDRVPIVCLSYFSGAPAGAARQFCRRLRQRWPEVKILLVLWTVPTDALQGEAYKNLGASEIATSIGEAIGRIHRLLPEPVREPAAIPLPERDAERVAALHRTAFRDDAIRDDLDTIAKRAAEAFDVDFAMVSAIDSDSEVVIGQSRELPGLQRDVSERPILTREQAICNLVVAEGETLVVPDAERDPRFSDNPIVRSRQLRFYAGAPLRSSDGFVLGALCILDGEARTLDERELKLLEKLASDVVDTLEQGSPRETATVPEEPEEPEPTATVGQPIPK